MTEIDNVSVKRQQRNSDYVVDSILGQKKKVVVNRKKCINTIRTIVIILIGTLFAIVLYLINRRCKRIYQFCCNAVDVDIKIAWDLLMTAI